MHLPHLFSVSIKEPLDFLQSAFIHKSALIRTVKFVEISENGIRYVHVSLGWSSGYIFSPSPQDILEGRSARVNSCATEGEKERCGSYFYLYIDREAHALSSGSLALSRLRPRASSRSFLAWAHLKRDPALVATARGSHSAAAQSSPTAQGSFNFANTQLFNIVSR